jgi:hypothetical protein
VKGRGGGRTGSLDELDASFGGAGGVEGQLLEVELAQLGVPVGAVFTKPSHKFMTKSQHKESGACSRFWREYGGGETY